jgi:hypothetical protein
VFALRAIESGAQVHRAEKAERALAVRSRSCFEWATWVADAPGTDQPKGAGVCLFYIQENLGFRKAPLLAEHYGPRKRTAR